MGSSGPRDPIEYWTKLHRRGDLSSVGQSGYSASWNEWLYRAWLRSADGFLKRHGVSAQSVCEVGAGTGAWFPVWRSLGAEHITAIDLVDVRPPADRVLQLDIGNPYEDVGTFDLVAAMYVLLHVTEDSRFAVALENLARMVKPGGWLVIADPMRLRGSLPRRPGADSVVRAYAEYNFPGFTLEALAAATVIAGDPVENRSISVRAAFGALSRIGSRFPSLIGPVVATLDPWLVTRIRFKPSAKLALYRRV